jgi:putative endonuclease
MTHYVYVLECGDGTYYTGYTNRLDERIEAHKKGNGAKYTRGRGPVELIYRETYETQSKAMSREHEIKQLDRTEKEALIAEKTESHPKHQETD